MGHDAAARISRWINYGRCGRGSRITSRRPDVDAVIVAQGTDTLEESAYLTARSLATPKPIIFTGAMRTSR